MEKVDGIGGLFLRSRDPVALTQWYQEHLGVKSTPTSYEELPWQQAAGPTAFSPFPDDSDYFGKISFLDLKPGTIFSRIYRDICVFLKVLV
jgi:glyoxylase I family protein